VGAMKTKFIFQDWIAAELVSQGFTCITRPDYKDKNRTVYVFILTPELVEALNRLFK